MGTSFSKREFEILFLYKYAEKVLYYYPFKIEKSDFVSYLHYSSDGSYIRVYRISCNIINKHSKQKFDSCLMYENPEGKYLHKNVPICSSKSLNNLHMCKHHYNQICKIMQNSKYLSLLFDDKTKDPNLVEFINSYYILKYNIDQTVITKIGIEHIDNFRTEKSKKLFVKLYMKYTLYGTRFQKVFKVLNYLFNNLNYSISKLIKIICNKYSSIYTQFNTFYFNVEEIYAWFVLNIINTYAETNYDLGEDLLYMLHCSKLSIYIFGDYSILRPSSKTLALIEHKKAEYKLIKKYSEINALHKYLEMINFIHKIVNPVLNDSIHKQKLYYTEFTNINTQSLKFIWIATVVRRSNK